MPFTVKDPALLDDMGTNDEVEGKLRVEYEGKEIKDYELVDLVVRKPAPAPSLTLSAASGEPRPGTSTSRLNVNEMVPDFRMTTQDGETLCSRTSGERSWY